MPQNQQPAFGDLIGKRLMELAQAGWLTPQEWQTAICHGPVSMKVIVHYLDRCLEGPSHRSQTA